MTCAKVAAYIDKGRERAGGDGFDALESGGGWIRVGVEDERVSRSGCSEVAGESEDIVVERIWRGRGMRSDEVEAERVDEDDDGA